MLICYLSDLLYHFRRFMGCCNSEERPDFRTNGAAKHLKLTWNTFVIDGANIKLSAPKRKLHRIVSKQTFPESGKYQIKIRYVSQAVSSFSIGVFHTSTQLMTEHIKTIKNVGAGNTLRLYVSKKEGEFQSQGETVSYSKDWKARLQDTIRMNVDMDSHVIEWKKQNTLDQQTHKTVFPPSFISKKLYLQLIMYEPDTQLNIQV